MIIHGGKKYQSDFQKLIYDAIICRYSVLPYMTCFLYKTSAFSCLAEKKILSSRMFDLLLLFVDVLHYLYGKKQGK